MIEARKPDIIVIEEIVEAQNVRSRACSDKGALGSVTREFDRWIEKLGITYNAEVMQKFA